MATKLILKKSSVIGKIPAVADLDYGEFAINYADEKLYFKNSNNDVKLFSADLAPLSLTTTHVLNTTSVTSQVICEIPTATYQSCKYVISAIAGTDVHMTEILAIHNGTNVYTTEYGEVISNSALGDFSVDISSGKLRLLVTAATTNSTTFTVYRTGIRV